MERMQMLFSVTIRRDFQPSKGPTVSIDRTGSIDSMDGKDAAWRFAVGGVCIPAVVPAMEIVSETRLCYWQAVYRG
jgi:hypothetical protein